MEESRARLELCLNLLSRGEPEPPRRAAAAWGGLPELGPISWLPKASVVVRVLCGGTAGGGGGPGALGQEGVGALPREARLNVHIQQAGADHSSLLEPRLHCFLPRPVPVRSTMLFDKVQTWGICLQRSVSWPEGRGITWICV